MKTIEQIDENFNVKKPKKKGLIIGAIVAVVIIAAIIVAYFLTLGNPKYIFGKTIDKLFVIDTQNYDSIKIDTEIKASVEAEDATYQQYLKDLEKLTIKAGAQLDVSEKSEIVNLGLDYDKESVIDAQVYYNNGDMYTYFDGLFDKYIQIEMDDEAQEQMNQIFESAISEEELEKNADAIKIFKDELKTQINEYGKFEKKKDKIDIGKEEEKVTKWTLTLTEKQLYNVLSKTFSNLAKNDKFIDCFEEDDIEEILKEAAESIKNTDADSKDNLKISIYTKGLLNKLVAVDGAIYSDLEEMTITASVVKEDDGVYEYKIYQKMSREKIDLLNGKVEIKKEKDSKKDQLGKIKIIGNIYELGSAELEIDYSIKYNQGIDKVNVKNSVNIDDLTEEDVNGIMQKLMERPLVSDLLTSMDGGLFEQAEDAADRTKEAVVSETIALVKTEILTEYYSQKITEEQITEQKVKEHIEKYLEKTEYTVEVTKAPEKLEFTITANGIEYKMNLEDLSNEGQAVIDNSTQTTAAQNEIRDGYAGYTIGFTVPAGFTYDDFSDESTKYYSLENADYSYVDAEVTIYWDSEADHMKEINSDYEYWKNSEDYKNVVLSEIKTINVGNKEFKYKILSYESNFGYGTESKYQDAYIWYPLGDEYVFSVKLEATDTEITEDIIKGFLNIKVTKLN